MQQVSTEFARILARPFKTPIFIMVFEGIATRYSSGPVLSPLGTTVQIANTPTGGGASITPDLGTASVSEVTFTLLDKAQQITALLAAYNFYNRKTVIKVGFADLAEADFATFFTGKIKDYTLSPDNITWQFTVASLLYQQKQDICTALTSLTAAILAPDVTASVASTSKFGTVGFVGQATNSKFYFQVDNEIMSYTGMTGTTFTGLGRAQLGTTQASHASGAKVTPLVVLQGAPIDLVLQILTSTGTSPDGVTAGTNGAYDLLPAHMALGIDVSLVDTSAMVRQQSTWLNGFVMKFEFQDSQEAKDFIESEIYQFVNAYPFTTNDGKISCKVYSAPLPSNPMAVLNDDNMVGPPTWASNPMSRFFFNEVDLTYDFDFLTGNFGSELLIEDAASQVKYDITSTKDAASKGLRTSINGLARITRVCRRFTKRFSTPSPVLKAKGFFSTMTIEVGDFVILTSSRIPDPVTGKMGITNRIMEVIKTQPPDSTMAMAMELADTGFAYGKKYGVISPRVGGASNFPNYLQANSAQRNYGFISKKVNDSVGVMSDGSDGYYITP